MKQFASTNIHRLSRRDFMKVASGLGISAAGMTLLEACGVKPATSIPEDATLETTTIRLVQSPSVCLTPQYLAEDLLKSEGFTEVRYVKAETFTIEKALASGDADISMTLAAATIIRVDEGDPLVLLGGVHVGCFLLFGNEQINTIDDLKGKRIPVPALGVGPHVFLASMVAWGGLDPNTDINWVIHPVPESTQLFSEGKVDALLAFPPGGQELRAKKIGHVVADSMMDKPWSQYFCCFVTANRSFAQKNPVATKKVLRAILQASDICAREPERAAHYVVDKGYTKAKYEYVLEAMQNIPYNRWREYDPEDTVIFYANRLRDAKLIKSNANDVIATGTNWHFLDEIKQEIKA
jgi:NitT/TauT family transport system substrate-binding protein